ncbi:MAG: hypothetical protein IAF02_26550, partial [Anaerolineae bacterium]|nr:hypothetical protein [Anaerolineae bacterium]
MNIVKKIAINVETTFVFIQTMLQGTSGEKDLAVITKMEHVPLRLLGLKDVPAVPIADPTYMVEMLSKLNARVKEVNFAVQGLSDTYTIGDEQATAQEFLFGKVTATSSLGAQNLDIDPETIGQEDLAWDQNREARDNLQQLLDKDDKFVLNLLEDGSFYRSVNPMARSRFDALVEPADNEFASNSLMPNANLLTNLSLTEAKQWAISWTNFDNVLPEAAPKLPELEASITSADEASKQFWPMIARYGLAYNLLILQKLGEGSINPVKQKFKAVWDADFDVLLKENRLYLIDLSIFTTVEPQLVDGNKRFTPGSMVILSQDLQTKALTPIAVRISGYQDKNTQIYTRDNATDAAWLYALQAAKTSITVYGIWLGHVYHWHMVTAAMIMTFLNNVPKKHPLFQLIAPQSDYLITFNTILLLLWSEIGPPTSISSSFQFLRLLDTFAIDRTFLDDDPIVTLARHGLEEKDFTVHEAWDQYPIVGQYLKFWQATEAYIDTFVETTYPNDAAVAKDHILQKWMSESAKASEGNIKGLPNMNSKASLKRVLTSLVYRITVHGASRLGPTANPMLTFVPNFPPCLQKTEIPTPTAEFDTTQLFEWLPKTGVIGKMMTFYFTFVFSKPYKPFVPLGGVETNLFFPHGMADPRNKALVEYRKTVADFIQAYYPASHPPQMGQWPLNI